MQLNEQVVSLKLSQKLKELGVKQESLFVWEFYDNSCHGIKYFPYAVSPYGVLNNTVELISAFTVAEIGEMLPGLFRMISTGYYLTMDCDRHVYYHDIFNKSEIYPSDTDDNDSEADARAKMLIHLIENKLLNLDS